MPLTETHLSSSEAARVLEIHKFSIQRLLRSATIPAEKIANRWLIPRSALEEFAKTYVAKPGRPKTKRKYTKRSPIWFR